MSLMKPVMMISLLMSVGCYSQSSYTEDVSVAFCTLYDDCDYLEVQQIADYDECIDVVSVSHDPENRDCDWDAGMAKDCVEGINQMTCDDLYDSDYPLACDKTCTRGQ